MELASYSSGVGEIGMTSVEDHIIGLVQGHCRSGDIGRRDEHGLRNAERITGGSVERNNLIRAKRSCR